MELNLRQNITTSIEQRLEMALSPKIIQMLKILNLPYLELIDRINKESEENVMLDIDKPEMLFEYMRFINKDKEIRDQVNFNEYPGIENLKNEEINLHQSLLNQLEIENPDEPYNQICQELIKHIDDRGYITKYTEIRPEIEEQFKASRPTIDKALKIIQSFEPDGVGARNLKECLEIQINEYNFETPELQDILLLVVKNHLDDLSEENFDKMAKDLDIKVDGVKQIANFIRENLTPYPGSSYGSKLRLIIPSFAIEEKQGKYQLTNLEKSYGPKLSINQQYHDMLLSKDTDEKTRKYLKEKIATAKELIDNINRRHETFEKITKIIAETQVPYFEKGKSWLKPLMQKNIAAEIGVHPSTISRAIAEKHILTPQGQVSYKSLCPREHKGFSSFRIQAMIKDIIENENHKSFSDEKIKELLKLEGVSIERRTVAAYRQKLQIPSSSQRGEITSER